MSVVKISSNVKTYLCMFVLHSFTHNAFQSPAGAPYSEDYRISNDAERDWVNGGDCLPSFREWIIDNEANFSTFDHAMMVTGSVNTFLLMFFINTLR